MALPGQQGQHCSRFALVTKRMCDTQVLRHNRLATAQSVVPASMDHGIADFAVKDAHEHTGHIRLTESHTLYGLPAYDAVHV